MVLQSVWTVISFESRADSVLACVTNSSAGFGGLLGCLNKFVPCLTFVRSYRVPEFVSPVWAAATAVAAIC